MKRLLYVSSLTKYPDRDSYWISEFSKLGWQVEVFSDEINYKSSLISKISYRLNLLSEINFMQKLLIQKVKSFKPNWVHFRLPLKIEKKVLLEIKQHNCLISSYYNDDPFSNTPFLLSYRFLKAIKNYDIHFVWRKINIDEFKGRGVKKVYHCPPCYDPLSRPLLPREGDFIHDAVFIGHFENDGRLKILLELNRSGIDIKIYGSYWDKEIKNTQLKNQFPIKSVYDDKYNFIYRNTIAGLCFFSKMNRDKWTRRPFEIISVGGLLVCERTKEAMSYFKDGKEALFFDSAKELVDIIRYLKSNRQAREQIRINGYERLIKLSPTFEKRANDINDIIEKEISFFSK